MKKLRQLLTSTALAGSLLMGAVGASAQTQQKDKQVAPDDPKIVTWQQDGQSDTIFVTAGGGIGYRVLSSEMSFDLKTVKGAPFSATATSESIQTLADGNRIIHKSSTNVFRDGEGRTRREQTVTGAGESLENIFINDPVSGFNYVLDTKSMTAQKMQNMRLNFNFVGRPTGDKVQLSSDTVRVQPRATTGATGPNKVTTAQGTGGGGSTESADGTVEVQKTLVQAMKEISPDMAGPGTIGWKLTAPVKSSLGTQTIEGVQAEGTKLTTTIPAGQIGNEQPIIIESESWYSSDLQAVVMSRTSDPRMGETTYKLTNINRNEPDSSLFQVPSDYTVQEPQAIKRATMMRKKDDEKQQ